MRCSGFASSVALVVLLFGCGGAPAKPAPVPSPPAPRPQVIDVASVEPLGPGFSFSAVIDHTEIKSGLDYTNVRSVEANDTVRLSYTVEIVAAGEVRVTFGTGVDESNSGKADLAIANHAYVVRSSGFTRDDGSAVSADENSLLTHFHQQGGLVLPVRDELAGHRLEKDQPVSLDAAALGKLLVQGVPPAATGTVTLRSIDDQGIATIEVAGNYDGGMIWTVEGLLLVDATTLLPASVSLHMHFEQSSDVGSIGDDVNLSETFKYGAAPAPSASPG